MTPDSPPYALPDPIPWRALAGPLAQADDALARLDERLRASPVREGWTARTHFTEACAALWLEGALVHLEDLVLHDSGMDIRAPTHELIRAHAILRARRRIAAEAPDWALSKAGLGALRSDAAGDDAPEEGRRQQGEPSGAMDSDAENSNDGGFDTNVIGDASGRPDGLEAEFAAVDAALARSQRVIDGESAAPRPRDPLVYDFDWNQDERLQAWRAARDQTRNLPPLLAGAFLWEAWQNIEPLQHRPWLGALLVAAGLREVKKTKVHLLCLNAGLRLVSRERRRAVNRTARLIAWGEAVAAAAEAGMKDHDRLALARRQLERKLVGRRSTSHLAGLIDLVLARPIASVGMIAKELGVTPRAAQNLVAELGLREATGRGRYRAWGIS
ncbi:RHE_PE00001 family protein [Methylocapsa sp. S129]|uniref:RHE_PE00001 family protein n=1 Tax=Methylocapsa sp. S129 TaxID=1641869 RepID=UPI00131BB710|nr:RHE_PE00001 family protein [Methylocapsa sp. S129]